jgi:hypothetical protein
MPKICVPVDVHESDPARGERNAGGQKDAAVAADDQRCTTLIQNARNSP